MRAALPFVLALPLAAADLDVTAPVAGAVYVASSRSIRPVLGVAGAAHLGDALAADLDVAFVSPDATLALARQGDKTWLIRNSDGASSAELPFALACAGTVVWSAGSGAAALSCPESSTVQWITALKTEAPASESIDVSSLGSPVSALAVDPGGSLLVAAAAGGGLYALASGESPRLIADLPGAAALVFSASGGELYVADRLRHQVIEIRSMRWSAEVSVFTTVTAGVFDPAGIAVAKGRLLVADRAARTVYTWDLATRAPAEVKLDFAPASLDPLRDGRLFVLRAPEREGEPMQVLDPVEGVSYFVPAEVSR